MVKRYMSSRLHTDPKVVWQALKIFFRKLSQAFNPKIETVIQPSPSLPSGPLFGKGSKKPATPSSKGNMRSVTVAPTTTISPSGNDDVLTRKTITHCAERIAWDALAGPLFFVLGVILHRTTVLGKFGDDVYYGFWLYSTYSICFIFGYLLPELRKYVIFFSLYFLLFIIYHIILCICLFVYFLINWQAISI